MAGILDSDFMRFLTNNSGYWEQRDKAKAAEQFGGLLGTLEQQGPSQPGQEGLLGMREPDQQFWLKAAQIPGYEDMASQQLGYTAAGSQAMARQQQQQQYEAGNMSLLDRSRLFLEQQRDSFAESIGIEDLRRKWAGTSASIEAAGASAQNSLLGGLLNQQRLTDLQNAAATRNGPLINQLPPQGQVDARVKLQTLNSAVDSAAGVMDWVKNRNPSDAVRGVGTGQGGAMLTDWVTSVMPIAKELTTGPGAVDEGEREFLMGIIKDPSSVVLNENTINQMQLINRKVEDYRDMNFNAFGLPVPKKKGRGATARALGPEPQGELKPYTPKRNAGGGRGLLDPGAP